MKLLLTKESILKILEFLRSKHKIFRFTSTLENQPVFTVSIGYTPWFTYRSGSQNIKVDNEWSTLNELNDMYNLASEIQMLVENYNSFYSM